MSLKRSMSTWVGALLSAAVLLALAPDAGAQTYKILHAFTGGTDGGGLFTSLVMDKQGNLYGVTSGGGAYGYGTVFELSPISDGTWTEALLYSFMNGDPVGQDPTGTLIFDAAGNLYGATPLGGTNRGGTAFQLTPGSNGWTATLLYSFGGYPGDAAVPNGGLIMDSTGNLYGTANGGANGTTGAVFELSRGATGWTETVPYSFGTTGVGGFHPLTGLVSDLAGDLYGTTNWGGDLACGSGGGCGVAYKLRPSSGGWKENVLHTFGSFPRDGVFPSSPLSFDSQGNLYGTVGLGGIHACGTGAGCGMLFKLAPTSEGAPWKESIIFQFRGGASGQNPQGALLFDGAGAIYGADVAGGTGIGCGCGVIYKLTPGANGQWTYKMLHSFNGADGALPYGGLIFDSTGNIYGTTITSGPGGYGVVFEITP